MKKILIAFLVLGAVTACKKGENDPFLSLKSRKARITGEWKVTGYEAKNTNSDGYSSTSTLNGSILTRVETANGFTTTEEGIYIESYTFNKDNTFTRTTTTDDETLTYTGNWAFGSKSKEGEIKNKETLVLNVTKTVTTTSGGTTTSTYTSLDNFTYVMFIDCLKSDELVFVDNYNATETDSDGTYTENSSSKTTLTK